MTELQTSGVTAPYKELINSLERNAKAVRDIVESNPAAVKLEQIQDLMHQITYVHQQTATHEQSFHLKSLMSLSALSGLMSYLTAQLNTTEEDLNFLYTDANVTHADLDALSAEANQLELAVQDLLQLVHNTKNANIEGEKPNR